jgi:hypothetical protein
VRRSEAARAVTARTAVNVHQEAAIFAGLQRPDTAPTGSQAPPDSRSASPGAIAAARDIAFEGLVEAGSLAESYSRSLAEAAWRGDRPTVEVHLRQLRACVVASIGIFKELNRVEAKGGGA